MAGTASIRLADPCERFVEAKTASGRHASVDAVIEAGRPAREFSAAMRKVRVGARFVCLRVEKKLRIVRIPHSRMHLQRHL